MSTKLSRLALALSLTCAPLLAQSAEQQILQTDRAWADAEIRHDASALNTILDDQFVVTDASGKTSTKQEFIKSLVTEDGSTITQDLTDRAVHVFGETAILTETDNYISTKPDHNSSGTLRLTTTYLHRGDHWVAIAEQMTTFTPNGNAATAEDTLRQLDSDWVNAAQSKDVNAWLAFYADDVTILPPNDKAAIGKAAARKSVAELLALPGISLTWQANHVDVSKSGDLAYLTGAYDLSFNDSTGKRVSDIGKTVEIWKLQIDGKWKCVADIWNSDLPITP